MTFKITILAALAAFTLMGQSASVAAKPEDSPKIPAAAPAPIVPVLQTAKFWRLFAQAQAARQQANETPQAKAAIVAEEEFKKEQNTLQVACGPTMQLAVQSDAKAENSGDVICQVKPPAPAPLPVPVPEQKKEK